MSPVVVVISLLSYLDAREALQIMNLILQGLPFGENVSYNGFVFMAARLQRTVHLRNKLHTLGTFFVITIK